MQPVETDRLGVVVYGTLVALGAGGAWGVLFIYTGAFRPWLAVALGALVGLVVRVKRRGLRGGALAAGAAALTLLGWWVAFYLAFFGEHLIEVAEKHGHEVANQVPVTIMFTGEFLRHFVTEVPDLVRARHLGWLLAGLFVAMAATRAPRPSS